MMIKLGKVAGSYMIDVACINKKLVSRALSILNKLYGLDEEEAMLKLKAANMELGKAIQMIDKETELE